MKKQKAKGSRTYRKYWPLSLDFKSQPCCELVRIHGANEIIPTYDIY